MNNTSVSATLLVRTSGVKDTQKDMTKQNKTEPNPWNQLTWTHRAHGEGACMAMSDLDPLHIHCGRVPQSSVGLLVVGAGTVPDSSDWFWDPFPPTGLPHSGLM